VNETNIQSAVVRDNVDTIAALLERGADTNQLDALGRTTFFEATKMKRVALMKLLVENDADINMKPPLTDL
jgi:ankyrin repeat protein